ncbi:magnesium/cobalt transporter CorA [Chitinimonas lacunae]|uniref:Magnesium transport protein CorA n=1 Tax=Chitinimonas lacunae TaxID=1963018 RepID=A0ABV8MNH5_9NEIS
MVRPASSPSDRRHLVGRFSREAGQPPGALNLTREAESDTETTLIGYGPEADAWHETAFGAADQSEASAYPVQWLDVHGLGNSELLEAIGRRFRLHPLTLEDILNTDQRPKVEIYDNYLYLVAKLVRYEADQVHAEQISLVLGQQFVLTFREGPGPAFDDLRERLQRHTGVMRQFGADHLAYALFDRIVDSYFMVIEALGERAEALEDELVGRHQTGLLRHIHNFRRELLHLRRALWPLRDMLNALQRDDMGYFQQETQLYLRDVYDHSVHLIESMEALRDLAASLSDLYMSHQSNRLNREMRFLTVIATIFMPLTFIAGVYGMNFQNMPELKWPWGYYTVLLVMALIGGSMGVFFWRRRWL